MYDDILYPTDGSEAAEAVIDHVTDLAKTYDATVHILYVVAPDSGDASLKLKKDDQGNWRTGMFKRKTRPESTSGMAKGSVDVNQVLRAEGKAYIQDIATDLADNGVASTSACLGGKPHEKILEYADENGIDLITMGTHGRSGIQRRFIGSVTEKVVRQSEIPVLTVHQNS